ncbi:hypothetical protein HELRODRAFT_186734 [Helobdella robusta]|uniref:Methyltransferase type 11 domain-containing protein n=1 Tax=Helobdella robusta TaxID=6412 RepID=T1FP27_HELRO|nr:hypothetical protein HELRODRAFT_186734 [Helobdella robusta]ESO09366.1 hypothetical protein HELRODRAFT_186734 [Helobdella robusta]
MDLLPKTRREFSSSSYWETFFKRRGNKAFEWYGEYSTFCGLLAKYIKLTDEILIPGCGNSEMGSQMFDIGYKNITSIDISSNVINQMTQKNIKSRPDLKFLEMDLFNTSFNDNEFNVILDKGTLDAVYSEDTEENRLKVDNMFKEIVRLLRLGGRYICISLAQQFIAEKIIKYFSNEGWLTRVCLAQKDEEDDSSSDKNEDDKKLFNMPIFMFVLTKFKKLPNSKPIFESSFFESKIERHDSVSDLLSAITDLQNYALVKQNLRQGKTLEDQLCVTLYNSSLSSPRYTIYVVDGRGNRKFAIFIVPQGRETEWMFSTYEGRKQLHKSCNYERLLIVLLNRFHEYPSLDLVKKELSSKVLQLAPPNVDKQSPFLTLGESVSVRSKQYEGRSELSGGFVVEDVQIDNKLFRRLIFYNRPEVVQSEVLLKKVVKRSKKKHQKPVESYEVDHAHMTCSYYPSVIAGLLFVQDFLNKLDEKFDVLILDVDNKDHTLPFSSPPTAFIEDQLIHSYAQIVSQDGVFILNLATRCQENRDMVITRLKKHFQRVYYTCVDEQINEIVYCLPTKLKLDTNNEDFIKFIKNNLEEFKKRLQTIDNQYKKPLEELKLINIKSA